MELLTKLLDPKTTIHKRTNALAKIVELVIAKPFKWLWFLIQTFILSKGWKKNIYICGAVIILLRYHFYKWTFWKWIYFDIAIFEYFLYSYCAFIILTNWKKN